MIPDVKDKFSLFIPELPGYGISSLPPQHDKRTVGRIIIEACKKVLGQDRPIIWCGHDRGARVGHRLLVDADPTHNLRAAILMDIVPTIEQWRCFSNPAASMGYFHWPFLALPTAPDMIDAMGGDFFCRQILNKGASANEAGANSIQADGAYELYCEQFKKRETIEGSCADYASASAAGAELEEQKKDQAEGRKVSQPMMVIYSAGSLGRMHDVESIWPLWADGELKQVGIGEGHGHYLPESCPEAITDLVLKWTSKVQQSAGWRL